MHGSLILGKRVFSVVAENKWTVFDGNWMRFILYNST